MGVLYGVSDHANGENSSLRQEVSRHFSPLTGLAFMLGRGMSSFLFGVKPLDPVTLLTVATMMLATSVAALIAPARRALKINPMDALREE